MLAGVRLIRAQASPGDARLIQAREATFAYAVPLRILLRPDPLEYARLCERYQEVAEDLEGEGVRVRILPATEVHAHAALPTSTSQDSAKNYELLIQVGSSAGEIVGTARLIDVVRRRLRGHGTQSIARHRAKIYIATGEEYEFSFEVGE